MSSRNLIAWAALLLACRTPAPTDRSVEANAVDAVRDTVQFGAAAGGLRLGVPGDAGRPGRPPGTLLVRWENVGSAPLEILRCVEAGAARHQDWLHLTLTGADGHSHDVALAGDRNRSARVTARLLPGQTVDEEIDVAAWAARGRALAPGTYHVRLAYEVPAEPPYWSGRIEAATVALAVGAPTGATAP